MRGLRKDRHTEQNVRLPAFSIAEVLSTAITLSPICSKFFSTSPGPFPLPAKRRFSGFRSRCTTSMECIYSMAETRTLNRSRASFSV